MKTILHCIRRLRIYHVFYKILNSIDYNLPQNRPRVYIVGIRKDIAHSRDFQFPQSQPLLINVSSIMDRRVRPSTTLTPNMLAVAQERVRRKRGKMTDNYIINVNGSVNGFGSAIKEVSPCLLANAFNFYSTKYRRILTAREHLRLQGFPDSFKALPDEKITKKQAGNSMSVNVLMALYRQLRPFLMPGDCPKN